MVGLTEGAAQTIDAVSGSMHRAQHKTRERIAGLRKIPGQRRLARVEIELPRIGQLVAIGNVQSVLIAKSRAMCSVNPGKIILVDIAAVRPPFLVPGTHLIDGATLILGS